ncbi:MAG: SPOR domain-containing protein [Candidatus Omnitrophota bacterium]|nr:SPOR domain-containing protein [Candidatus Omnitrophota bacterium]
MKKILAYSIGLLCALSGAGIVHADVRAGALEEAYKNYITGDYEEALLKARAARQNDEALYFLGLVYIKMENYPQAREYLTKLTQHYSSSRFFEQGLLRLADTYYLEGDAARARLMYEDIEKKRVDFTYMPTVYLRLSQIAAQEGRWDDNKKYAAIIRDKYPVSPEAQRAMALENNDNFFSVQVGAFSQKKNALELAGELEKTYTVTVIEDKNAALTLYKVRVGKFSDRQKAEQMRFKLTRQGYPARIYP